MINKEISTGSKVYHRNLKLHGITLPYEAMVPNQGGNWGTFVEFTEGTEDGEIEVGDIREVSTNLLNIIEKNHE